MTCERDRAGAKAPDKDDAMTDPIAATTAAARVTGALKKASAATGVGFDYLYKVARRESALDPTARAKTSTAAGLFQFIEQTWLASVKKYGAAHGMASEAAAIEKGASGKFRVADAAQRQAILNLRFDPEKAAALAGELARENKAALEKSLGRAVDAAELYAAHFLGPAGAVKLLSAPREVAAASLAPQAAASNKPVFFDGARARTVDEVMESFRRTIGAAQATIAEAGEAIEKSLAPLLREGAALFGARESAALTVMRERADAAALRAIAEVAPSSSIETKGAFSALSPLALAVLQALDPRELRKEDEKRASGF
jgi:hypothetical protein